MGIGQDAYERQPGIDVLSYDVQIELNDSNDRITAKSEIEFSLITEVENLFWI